MRCRRTRWFLALSVAGWLPGMAMAQEEAIVVGRRERPPLLTLDPFRGSAGFRGIYSTVTRENRGEEARATNLLMTQDLTLSGSGSVVSQDFMKWYGTVTGSLQEMETKAEDVNESSFGFFGAYDFRTDMLETTAFPLSFFALRNETYVDRTFAALLKSTTNSYGGTIRYDSPSIPSTLSFIHTDISQADLGGDVQFNTSNDQISAATSFQPLERHFISMNYSYGNVSQENPGVLTNSFSTQTADLSHSWSIDPNGRFTLTEGVSYSEETGLFPSKVFNGSETLHMNLTEYLQSQIDYRFINQQSGRANQQGDVFARTANELTSHNISGSLSHRLYQSLFTTLRAGANFNDSSFSGGSSASSSSNNYFTSITTNYTKELAGGIFGANLGLGYDVAENSSSAGIQTIAGERATFTDPQPIVLTRQGIRPDSILVYDASGTRLLVRGIDYTVREVGNTVQINRIVGGELEPQETVRLNYLLDPQAAYTSETTKFSAGANYLFQEGFLNGLKLYTQYYQSNQSISSTGGAILPDNVRDTLLGADYHIWKLDFRAEGQDHESTLAPYRALRLSARYSDNLDARTNLTLDLSQNFVDYPDEGSQVALTAAGGQMSYEIMRNLTARAIVRWRNEEDSERGQTMGIEEQLRLEWKVRQTNMYMGVRHTNLDTPTGSSESLFFQLGISRNF